MPDDPRTTMVPPLDPVQLLTDVELAAMLKCGRSTVWRLVSDGTLPAPDVKLGTKLTRWSYGAVKSAIEQLAGEPAAAAK